jgi:hypothetical protein
MRGSRGPDQGGSKDGRGQPQAILHPGRAYFWVLVFCTVALLIEPVVMHSL